MKINKFQMIGATVLMATALQVQANPIVIPASTSHHQPVMMVNNQPQASIDLTVLHFNVQNNGNLTLKDKVVIKSDNSIQALKIEIAYGDLHHQKTTIMINHDGTVTQQGKPASMVPQGSYNVVLNNDWQQNYNPATKTFQVQKELLTNMQTAQAQQAHSNDIKQVLKIMGAIGLAGVALSVAGIGYALNTGEGKKKEHGLSPFKAQAPV